jgi:hypothetical protein
MPCRTLGWQVRERRKSDLEMTPRLTTKVARLTEVFTRAMQFRLSIQAFVYFGNQKLSARSFLLEARLCSARYRFFQIY